MLDAVIVGGGAAANSLLAHLGAVGWRGSVAVVDQVGAPLEGRSWAWWSRGDMLLDPWATRTIDRVVTAGPGWKRDEPAAPYRYCMITGEDLATAVASLTSGLDVRKIAGRALAVTVEGNFRRVTVDTGGTRSDLVARRVFDSVGVGRRDPWVPEARLDFLGLQIRATTDVFAPDAITLMDFRIPQDDGPAFMYVLPTSPREALVERTSFLTRPGASGDAHRDRIGAYVDNVLRVGEWTATVREEGVIPLTAPPPAPPGVTAIGVAAGMIKASTGYAFARIQHHSACLAAALAQGRDPAACAVSRRWPRVADRALLRTLARDPAGTRRVLEAMLRRNTIARVLAFLDEDLGAAAQARMFATLPLGIMARGQIPIRR